MVGSLGERMCVSIFGGLIDGDVFLLRVSWLGLKRGRWRCIELSWRGNENTIVDVILMMWDYAIQ